MVDTTADPGLATGAPHSFRPDTSPEVTVPETSETPPQSRVDRPTGLDVSLPQGEHRHGKGADPRRADVRVPPASPVDESRHDDGKVGGDVCARV